MATSSTSKKKAATKAPAKRGATKASAKKAPAKQKSAPSRAATKKAPTKAASSKRPPAKATAKKAPAKAAAKKTATKKAPAKTGSPKTGKSAVTSPYDAKFLGQQREALVAERATYLRQADALQAEADLLVAEREPGDVQFDEESGEGDTLAVERARDLALSAQARQQIAEIDLALGKIDDGSYGVCEVSGKPIPKERLRAIPWARVRVEYKTGGIGQR